MQPLMLSRMTTKDILLFLTLLFYLSPVMASKYKKGDKVRRLLKVFNYKIYN